MALNVGVFFNARRSQGGLYQYGLTLVQCLSEHATMHEYTIVFANLEDPPIELTVPTIKLPNSSVAINVSIELAMMGAARLGFSRPIKLLPQYQQIKLLKPDLMIYVKPTMHSFLWPHKSVFPIHDLQHLMQPSFPEVSSMGERSRREFIYRNATRVASAVLADSETGRKDILASYRIDPARVFALPYLAPNYLSHTVSRQDLERVKAKYEITERYLFYPAAFWKHKNHEVLLRAMKVLENDYGIKIDLVLAGGFSFEYERIRTLTHSLGLAERVRFLGHVPDEDMYALYSLAFALTMPTYFGPTNIPILEAWSLGCPVLTSNVRGMREQVGDAGLLGAPDDVQSWARQISRLLEDETLRATLVRRGEEKVEAWGPRDFAERLEHILTESAAADRG